MSYCRFSCDDWASDVYLYEDCQCGWTLHVATNRVLGDVPKLKTFGSEGWIESHATQMKFMSNCKREPIGLPEDGESYRIATIDEVYNRLQLLRVVGYHVPEHTMQTVKDEVHETLKSPRTDDCY